MTQLVGIKEYYDELVILERRLLDRARNVQQANRDSADQRPSFVGGLERLRQQRNDAIAKQVGLADGTWGKKKKRPSIVATAVPVDDTEDESEQPPVEPPLILGDGGIDEPPYGPTYRSQICSSPPCAGAEIQWYRDDSPISSATAPCYIIGIDDIGSSIYYQYTCPGEPPQNSDPVQPYVPTYDFSVYGDFNAKIYYNIRRRGTIVDCLPPVDKRFEDEVFDSFVQGTANAYGSIFSTATADATAPPGPPELLSSTIQYTIQCGVTGGYTLSINGLLSVFKTTSLPDLPDIISLWGSNVDPTLSEVFYSLFHSTAIEKIELLEDVPGLGITGDDITNKGLAWLYSTTEGLQAPRDTGLVVSYS